MRTLTWGLAGAAIFAFATAASAQQQTGVSFAGGQGGGTSFGGGATGIGGGAGAGGGGAGGGGASSNISQISGGAIGGGALGAATNFSEGLSGQFATSTNQLRPSASQYGRFGPIGAYYANPLAYGLAYNGAAATFGQPMYNASATTTTSGYGGGITGRTNAGGTRGGGGRTGGYSGGGNVVGQTVSSTGVVNTTSTGGARGGSTGTFGGGAGGMGTSAFGGTGTFGVGSSGSFAGNSAGTFQGGQGGARGGTFAGNAGGTFGGGTAFAGGTAGTFGGGAAGGFQGNLGGNAGIGGRGGVLGGGATGLTGLGANNYGGNRPAQFYSTELVFAIPAPPPAGQFRNDVQNVIVRSGALPSRENIRATTDGDVIVLRGDVGSSRERALAEAVVKLKPGVYSVRNELQVRETAPPPRPSP